jgi:5'(3')-deoxyribonucleotidase
MRIGIDVDGVLADFNSSFINRVTSTTGRDLFPPRPFDIPCWDYPEYYGYTREETSQVWETIKSDRFFWQNLPTYPTTLYDLFTLAARFEGHDDDLYFITSRPGIRAKRQTENWLEARWPARTVAPLTVLISSRKGDCARALNLDVYVDDRIENVVDVVGTGTRTFLYSHPWNLTCSCRDITRITSLAQMF